MKEVSFYLLFSNFFTPFLLSSNTRLKFQLFFLILGGQGEHEASKRAKAEFLIHLDGIMKCHISSEAEKKSRVLFLASTNLPWTIDPAFLRRFQKIVEVPLPGPNQRLSILKNSLKGQDLQNLDLNLISENYTEEFSGNECPMNIFGSKVANFKIFEMNSFRW